MIKVLLAAGHGAGPAHNRGALCYNEGDNNFEYSLVLKSELEKYKGVSVDLLRKKITDNPSLSQRSAAGKGYDLYFSIHSNAIPGNASVRGTEIWDSVERPNRELAEALCSATANVFNHNNRGVKYRAGQTGYNWYGELRYNEAKSAMIVEHGFHTNYTDCSFFKNNHRLIASVQAGVIATFYGLQAIPTGGPSEWAVEAWAWATEKGLLDGTKPLDALTREQLAVVLHRINKLYNREEI